MKVVVEIAGQNQPPFDLTLDFAPRCTYSLKPECAYPMNYGSWTCVPGRMDISDGYFEIKHGDLNLFDKDTSTFDGIKFIVGVYEPRNGEGVLENFQAWFDRLAMMGNGWVVLPNGNASRVRWTIKSGGHTWMRELVKKLLKQVPAK